MKTILMALGLAFTFAVVAPALHLTPFSTDQAFAKNGVDDPAGDDRGTGGHGGNGGDDPAGDDHGGSGHGADDPAGDDHGGSGHGGNGGDDGPGHT